jgi:hypothetical protein
MRGPTNTKTRNFQMLIQALAFTGCMTSGSCFTHSTSVFTSVKWECQVSLSLGQLGELMESLYRPWFLIWKSWGQVHFDIQILFHFRKVTLLFHSQRHEDFCELCTS